MNRKQKRKLVSYARKKGISESAAKIYLRLKELDVAEKTLADGDKVKLNLSSIQKHPDYHALSHEYKRFVESKANNIFTVSSKNVGNLKSVVRLEESPQWLFWTGNLIKVNE